LAQLASHIQAVVKYSHSENPFAKVKGMLKDMIAKLERDAQEDTTEKAYCDDETAKTEEKQGELNDDISKLTVKIDRAAARSTKLKEEVQELQAELAGLAKEQASMEEIRSAAHAEYVRSKADMEQGIRGVKEALNMLRRYYGGAASSASAAAMLQDNAKADKAFEVFMQQPEAPQKFDKGEGAGGSILSVLEVVESDFAIELTKIEAEEADEQMEYDKISQENAVVKTKKVQDVKYTTQEFVGIDESLSRMSADRDNANVEAAAVSEYYAKLKDRCVAKPEAYADRAQRRTAEIDGLKEALEILKSDTALIQQSGSGKHAHSHRLRVHSPRVLGGR
jgi:chromosome segregation ATPase